MRSSSSRRAACIAVTLAALSSTGALAQTTSSDVPVARQAAFVASAVGVSVGAGVLSIYLGTRPQAAYVDATGRPEPLITATGFALSLGLNFALTHLVVPWLTALGNTDGRAGDPTAARLEAWNAARWGLVASAAGLATTFIGAGVERASFGRGQGVMLAGLVIMLAGTLATDVLEAVGAWRGYTQTRSAR